MFTGNHIIACKNKTDFSDKITEQVTYCKINQTTIVGHNCRGKHKCNNCIIG